MDAAAKDHQLSPDRGMRNPDLDDIPVFSSVHPGLSKQATSDQYNPSDAEAAVFARGCSASELAQPQEAADRSARECS